MPEKANRPARFRWLKRLSLGSAVLVIALIVLRLIWGQVMQSRMDQLVQEIQATGDPILFEDLVQEPLSNPDNGAWYLKQALQNWPTVPGTAGIHIDDTDWYNDEGYGFNNSHPDPITDNPAYLQQCRPVLDLIHQAGTLNDADWGYRFQRPIFVNWLSASVSHYSDMRRLARLMEDAAQRAIDSGQPHLFMEIALANEILARHVQSRPNSLLAPLVGGSIRALNAHMIQRLLPMIDPESLRNGKTRDLAEKLMSQFIDDKVRHEALIDAFIAERYITYDVYQCVIEGIQVQDLIDSDIDELLYDTPGIKNFTRPQLMFTQHVMVKAHTLRIESLRQRRSYAELMTEEDRYIADTDENAWHYPLDYWSGAFASIFSTYNRVEAKLRMAAIALAIKLYEADHGRRPETLDQLVPHYLAEVPADPFDPKGGPIRYVPQGIVPTPDPDIANVLTEEQRSKLAIKPYALLYTVDRDGIDNGGGLHMSVFGHLEENYASDGEEGDIYFLLDASPKQLFTQEDVYDDAYWGEFGGFDHDEADVSSEFDPTEY